MLTNQDIDDAINTTKSFLVQSEVFLSSMDEARRTCQICHKRPRDLNGRIGVIPDAGGAKYATGAS